MRISPLNLLFALLMGYMAFSLLNLYEQKQKHLHELIQYVKIYHVVIGLAIILLDIIFRAVLQDTKKLWLVESLFIVLVGGIIQLLNIITPTSLFF